MNILNRSVLRFALVPGRLDFPGHSMTVVVKGTFDMHPGGPMTPAEEQLVPVGCEYYPDDPKGEGSLYYDSDFAPYKPAADLLLVGTCHAPGGVPTLACPVTFEVGSNRRALSVRGDRYWDPRGSGRVAVGPVPFRRMPLRYERAYGGPQFAWNPAGIGSEPVALTDDQGKPRSGGGQRGAASFHPLPNIEDIDNPVSRQKSVREPAGFGPLRAEWAERQSRLGTFDEAWLEHRWPWLPADVDWHCFNAAPPEMQCDGTALKGDEAVRLRNLHPEIEQYRTALPGIRARCFVVRNPTIAKQVAAGASPADHVETEEEEDDVTIRPRAAADVDETGEETTVVRSTGNASAVEEQDKTVVRARPDAGEAPAGQEFNPLDTIKIPGGYRPGDASRAPEPDDMQDFEELPMALDTLWIDADAERAVLVWRGFTATATEEFEDIEHLFLIEQALEEPELTRRECWNLFQEALAESQPQAGPEAPETPDTNASPEAPEGPDLDAQIEAQLDAFGLDEAAKAKARAWIALPPHQLERTIAAEIRAIREQAGLDPDVEPELTAAQQKAKDDLLAQMGLDPAEVARAEAEFAERQEQMGDLGKPLTRAQVEARLASGTSLADARLCGLDLKDLSFAGADLQRADLSGADLSGVDLAGALLGKATLAKARLTGARLGGASAAGALFVEAALDKAELSEADLTGARLAGAALPGATLAGTVLAQADLTDAVLDGADLTRANLHEAVLKGASLRDATLVAANLHGSRLLRTTFDGSAMRDVTLTNAVGSKASFANADLTSARVSGRTALPRGRFAGAVATGSTWRGADLSGADLSHMKLEQADLSKADLSGAHLYGADLRGARLKDANLQGARMVNMNLFMADLTGADLAQADISDSNLYAADLVNARVLETIATRANLRKTLLESASST